MSNLRQILSASLAILIVLAGAACEAGTPVAPPAPGIIPEPAATKTAPPPAAASPTSPSSKAADTPEAASPPSMPDRVAEFSNLGDLQKAARFTLWLPDAVPDNLSFSKGWISDYANGDQNVRLLYSEPGNALDANLKSLDIQMKMTGEIVSLDSLAHQFKVNALDVQEVRVRDHEGFTYWTQSSAAGNSACLAWREGNLNFSISLSGAWPQPDESDPHRLDATLLMVAGALQVVQ